MRSAVGWVAALVCACETPRREPPPPPSPAVEVQQPAGVEVPQPPQPEPAAVVPAKPAAPTIAPGTDEPPAQPSTSADSELQAPGWAKGGLDRIDQEEGRALFERAGAGPFEAGTFAGGLVVCKVGVDGWTDGRGLFGSPDLTTHLTLGDNAQTIVRGEEDTQTMVVAQALATLAPGAAIRARVVDRDFFRDRTLATIQGKYRGTLPWVGGRGPATLECRALVGAALDEALVERLAGCDEVLTEVAPKVAFDPENAMDLGFAASGLVWARNTLRGPARLVGWADPRVSRRVEWYRRIERPFVVEAEAFLTRTLAAAPPASEMVAIVPGEFRGRVQGWACGPEAIKLVDRAAHSMRRGDAKRVGGCALQLEIEAVGREALVAHTFVTSLRGIAAPRLVLANGEMVELEGLALTGATGDSTTRTLAPGQRGTLIAIPRRRFTAEAEPRPVLIATGAEEGALRVWLRIP